MAKLAELPFTKGHGTSNDFVLIQDSEARWVPTAEQVQWLCNRRQGLGGDGVIRVVPTSRVPEYADLAAANWFMDYRNSDGSIAEMCGNGARVFARYLLASGLESSREFLIATRAGLHQVIVHEDFTVSISMGQARIMERDDVTIDLGQGKIVVAATGVSVPNPHAVAMLPSGISLTEMSLTEFTVSPIDAFPQGVNVEFVQVIGERHVQMRVVERGSGETMSCGTGACAVASVAMKTSGATKDLEWQVDVPGGSLWVIERDGQLWLRGSAELVARGKVLFPSGIA